MNNKNYSLTVGIPTYYGGPALIQAVKTILASKNVNKFRIIVCIDGNPLDKETEKELKKMKVELILSQVRGGQVARIKQIISLTKSDLLITSQDDVVFKQNSIRNIITAFNRNKTLTMIGANVLPLRPKTFFESIIRVGVKLTHRMGELWNKGDNYLLASGRCLAFRTSHIKKFVIPEEIINSDAYLYFENKRHKGSFSYLKNARVYIRSPQNLKEHLKQSRKFQFSYDELTKFIKKDLRKDYIKPKVIIFRAFIDELLKNPFYTLLYISVFIYTRLTGQHLYSKTKRFWDTDVSTKLG